MLDFAVYIENAKPERSFVASLLEMAETVCTPNAPCHSEARVEGSLCRLFKILRQAQYDKQACHPERSEESLKGEFAKANSQ